MTRFLTKVFFPANHRSDIFLMRYTCYTNPKPSAKINSDKHYTLLGGDQNVVCIRITVRNLCCAHLNTG